MNRMLSTFLMWAFSSPSLAGFLIGCAFAGIFAYGIL